MSSWNKENENPFCSPRFSQQRSDSNKLRKRVLPPSSERLNNPVNVKFTKQSSTPLAQTPDTTASSAFPDHLPTFKLEKFAAVPVSRSATNTNYVFNANKAQDTATTRLSLSTTKSSSIKSMDISSDDHDMELPSPFLFNFRQRLSNQSKSFLIRKSFSSSKGSVKSTTPRTSLSGEGVLPLSLLCKTNEHVSPLLTCSKKDADMDNGKCSDWSNKLAVPAFALKSDVMGSPQYNGCDNLLQHVLDKCSSVNSKGLQYCSDYFKSNTGMFETEVDEDVSLLCSFSDDGDDENLQLCEFKDADCDASICTGKKCQACSPDNDASTLQSLPVLCKVDHVYVSKPEVLYAASLMLPESPIINDVATLVEKDDAVSMVDDDSLLCASTIDLNQGISYKQIVPRQSCLGSTNRSSFDNKVRDTHISSVAFCDEVSVMGSVCDISECYEEVVDKAIDDRKNTNLHVDTNSETMDNITENLITPKELPDSNFTKLEQLEAEIRSEYKAFNDYLMSTKKGDATGTLYTLFGSDTDLCTQEELSTRKVDTTNVDVPDDNNMANNDDTDADVKTFIDDMNRLEIVHCSEISLLKRDHKHKLQEMNEMYEDVINQLSYNHETELAAADLQAAEYQKQAVEHMKASKQRINILEKENHKLKSKIVTTSQVARDDSGLDIAKDTLLKCISVLETLTSPSGSTTSPKFVYPASATSPYSSLSTLSNTLLGLVSTIQSDNYNFKQELDEMHIMYQSMEEEVAYLLDDIKHLQQERVDAKDNVVKYEQSQVHLHDEEASSNEIETSSDDVMDKVDLFRECKHYFEQSLERQHDNKVTTPDSATLKPEMCEVSIQTEIIPAVKVCSVAVDTSDLTTGSKAIAIQTDDQTESVSKPTVCSIATDTSDLAPSIRSNVSAVAIQTDESLSSSCKIDKKQSDLRVSMISSKVNESTQSGWIYDDNASTAANESIVPKTVTTHGRAGLRKSSVSPANGSTDKISNTTRSLQSATIQAKLRTTMAMTMLESECMSTGSDDLLLSPSPTNVKASKENKSEKMSRPPRVSLQQPSRPLTSVTNSKTTMSTAKSASRKSDLVAPRKSELAVPKKSLLPRVATMSTSKRSSISAPSVRRTSVLEKGTTGIAPSSRLSTTARTQQVLPKPKSRIERR